MVRFSGWGGGLVVACVLSSMFLLPTVALASNLPPQEVDIESGPAGGARLTDKVLDTSGRPGKSMALWTWSKGRRAYTAGNGPQLGAFSARIPDESTVVAYDLDSLQEVARRKLPELVAGYNLVRAQNAAEDPPTRLDAGAVDEDGGRFFVAVQAPSSDPLGGKIAAAESAKRREVCTAVIGDSLCPVAVYVLDGDTLEVMKRVSLASLTVDGSPVAWGELLHMEYAPPRGPSENGKLLLLVQDQATSLAGEFGGRLNYAMQVDPDRGVVDWATRVDGCRSHQPRRTTTGATATSGDWIDDNVRTFRASIFRGPSVERPSVWVACHNTGQTAAIVRIPLDAAGFPSSLPVRLGDPSSLVGSAANHGVDGVAPQSFVSQEPGAQQVFPGPRLVAEVIGDAASERIALRVLDGSPKAEVWWIFDGARGAFVGTIGIGQYQIQSTIAGLDRQGGRLYVLAPATSSTPGGLYMADIRRTPIPQALVFPELAHVARPANHVPLSFDYGDGTPDHPRRILVRAGQVVQFGQSALSYPAADKYRFIEDTVALSIDPKLDISSGRSLDLDEIDGVTQATYDGAARGYAARALFVSGLESAGRAGPFDPTYNDQNVTPSVAINPKAPYTQCTRTNRQVVLGFVGPRDAAVVDGNGSRGGAEPVVVDSATRSDSELVASRCGPRGKTGIAVPNTQLYFSQVDNLDWEGLWGAGLFSRPPVGEPSLPWQFGDGNTSCVSSDAEPSASFGDPVTGMFASHVECGAEEASGFGYARGVGVDGLNVSEAISKFRIYRDPGRGIVSRVESVARGIDVGGTVKIDTVRGVAESWANGRNQPLLAEDRDEGYNPNCDFERTAGTCFSRHIFGVKTPVYSCGPCGDEKALVEGLSRAMGANGRVRLRDPDETLRVGAPNGYIAAIQKPAHERFGDVVLNDDLLQTTLPSLEIIRYTTPGPVSSERRGLQVYQFAGVEVSSSYGIQCLLVYDEATNTCGAEAQVPGSITISLADEAGKPLAGGGFEVRKDVDGDGVVGLVDTLLPDGACVTADDGIGTCQFENLQPGSYLVSQMVAPAGYSKISEPWVSEVASGEARVVAFVNSSDTSTVVVNAADEDGKPLAGAAFAVFADPDGDGKVAADAQPVATCTTDSTGSCTMAVPSGSYVLVQTGAPGGLELIEPVSFVFASGGQTAAVGITNYPLESVGPIEPAAGPVYTAPTYTPPVETVTDYTPTEPVDRPQISVPERVGGTIVQVIKAPGDVLRLLSRDPMAAAAWIVSLMLFAVTLLTIRRRQHAIRLMQ